MPENQINNWVYQQPNSVQQQIKTSQIYYHPSWLTRIFVWILWLLWIIMIWVWLLNFSLLFTSSESLKDIVFCWWGFLAYWIWLLFAWNLLYNNKKWMHLWVSFLIMLFVNALWNVVIWTYWLKYYDSCEYFDNDWFNIIRFISQAYFLVVTIIWFIKYLIFKKKWKASQKTLNPTKDKKKLSYITLIFIFMVLGIDIIYGKILFLNIPKVDISNFARSSHIISLPEWEDWVAIIKEKEKNEEINKIWHFLDRAYLNRFNVTAIQYSEKNLSWKEHPDECIKVYSWGQAYCWTWAWNENTIKRLFRNQLNEEYVKSDETLEWKTISLYSYLEERESEIRKEILELDRLLSMDYNAKDWLVNDLLPQDLQTFWRWSIVLIEYYSLKKDWDMVEKIVSIDYKIIDIVNNFWWLIWILIWGVIEENLYTNLNSSIQIFPEDVRLNLVKLIKEKSTKYDEILWFVMQWELENWAAVINENSTIWKKDPWLKQLFYHFPFYSESDTKRLINHFYSVYHYWLINWSLWDYSDFYDKLLNGESNFRWSVYNIQWGIALSMIAPRRQWGMDQRKRTWVHKESLLKNLETWKYDVWYSEPEWKKDDYYYRTNLIEE